MAIDFELTPEQVGLRQMIQTFAATHLKPARKAYEAALAKGGPWSNGFRANEPVYRAAVQAGLIKALVPAPLGGLGAGLVEAALAVEEYYAVETSASLTILGTGLGLTPLIAVGSPEQHEKFLKPFLSGEGAPLAAFVFSEPKGSANFKARGTDGFETTARLEGGEWVIDGEKIWATNSGGWDDKGADLQCVVCRIVGETSAANGHSTSDPASETAIVMVTKKDIERNPPEAYRVLEHPRTSGHIAVNGPHIRFQGLRVPEANLLAPAGKGAEAVEITFTGSATLVCAMSVGIMRQAFDYALAWAKSNTRGSNEAMIHKQSVQDLLIQIKIRCEAARALMWKSAHGLGRSPNAAELCYEAKIFGSESAVQSVQDAINLVGVSAYSKDMPLIDLMNDAMVLPIFDGGNVGVRRRQIAAIFASDGYQPWEATFGAEKTTNGVNGH